MKNSSDIKVGDLVCFNSAGMRKKSIGLVTAIYTDTATGTIRGVHHYVHIYWSLPPSIPPRAEWGDPRNMSISGGYGVDTYSKMNKTEAWYRDRGHFETIS
jgi:hypothetical protein